MCFGNCGLDWFGWVGWFAVDEFPRCMVLWICVGANFRITSVGLMLLVCCAQVVAVFWWFCVFGVVCCGEGLVVLCLANW